MASHGKGIEQKQFCALRTNKCKDGNEYRENCKPSPLYDYRAHHILCVASVTQYLATVSTILPIVEQTKWCINKKSNMLAMPLWGMFMKAALQRHEAGNFTAPSYNKIPMHNYGHTGTTSYKTEIDNKMIEIAQQMEESTAAHKNSAKKLAAALNGYRGRMKGELKRRGGRGAGTHVEWQGVYGGVSAADHAWYMPFSMADDGDVEPRPFPCKKASSATAAKIAKLVKNLL